MAGIVFTSIVLVVRGQVEVEGRLAVWHPIALTFAGARGGGERSCAEPVSRHPAASHVIGPAGRRFDVPGFFDGDGQVTQGTRLRVSFCPDAPGAWRYEARFRTGPGVAVQTGTRRRAPARSARAEPARSTIVPRDPEAAGFLKWGRLAYAGKHYLKFAEGPYWIRGGTDEPKIFWATWDSTTRPPGIALPRMKRMARGDPDWGGGRGRGTGALDYLARQHVNSIYFLTMNVGGDGKDVWPWTGPIDPGKPRRTTICISTRPSCAQWETVSTHAQRSGIFLHFVLQRGRGGQQARVGRRRARAGAKAVLPRNDRPIWPSPGAGVESVRGIQPELLFVPTASGLSPTICWQWIPTIIRLRCIARAIRSRSFDSL